MPWHQWSSRLGASNAIVAVQYPGITEGMSVSKGIADTFYLRFSKLRNRVCIGLRSNCSLLLLENPNPARVQDVIFIRSLTPHMSLLCFVVWNLSDMEVTAC